MRGVARLDGLGEDPSSGPSMEAADPDPAPLVVEDRDREALVGPGVLERVEANQSHVLEAAARAGFQEPIPAVDLRQPTVDRLNPGRLRIQCLTERGPR